MQDLYELYTSKSDKAQQIIDDYELSRRKVRWFGINEHDKFKEGLTLLKHQTIQDLEELLSETFGVELLMSESIRFLMYLLTIQFKPYHDWDDYYIGMLDYFHSKDLLKWKYKYLTQKGYKDKWLNIFRTTPRIIISPISKCLRTAKLRKLKSKPRRNVINNAT